MRHSITSNFKNLSMNWETFVLHLERWNFEPIMNSVHTTKSLALRKALIKNIDYFMYYPGRQYVNKNALSANLHSTTIS